MNVTYNISFFFKFPQPVYIYEAESARNIDTQLNFQFTNDNINGQRRGCTKWTESMTRLLKRSSSVGKSILITKIKANTVNTCFLCEILNILIWNMLNSMKENHSLYHF